MAVICSSDRATAWNILILDNTVKRRLAGAYQSIDVPLLKWKDFFDGLLLCFHLEPYATASDAGLALHLLHEKDVFAHNLDNQFLYYNSSKPGLEEQISQFIKLTALNGPEGPNPPTTLPVSLILHDYAHCKDIHAELANYLQSGMLSCHQ